MRRHLNTLYVTQPGAYLAKEGETVAVRLEHETRLRVPVHNLGSIVCFGPVTCSPFLMELCGERDVTLGFYSESGRFLARVHGRTRGNVLLRREQYRRADDPAASARLARSFILGKLANARVVLQRGARESTDHQEALQSAATRLGLRLREAVACEDLAMLRGIEGLAARDYLEQWNRLLRQQHEDFALHQRNRRPPLDAANALLSFLYTLLRHDVEAALEGVGLDPAVGFLHRDRPGRPSLALDLMEELRPYLADRVALSLINRRQVTAEGFRVLASGGVQMDDATRKTVLVTYQTKKQQEIQHAFLGEPTTVGLVPHLQALLLARHLRGDLDSYPPFVTK